MDEVLVEVSAELHRRWTARPSALRESAGAEEGAGNIAGAAWPEIDDSEREERDLVDSLMLADLDVGAFKLRTGVVCFCWWNICPRALMESGGCSESKDCLLDARGFVFFTIEMP